MKNLDILNEVHHGSLNEDEADLIFDSIIESEFSAEVASLLNLTRHEWTAKAQGANWRTLASWRYSGWPENCARCGKKLNYLDFGWWVISEGETQILKHIKCPKVIENI
ncbi:hypothetical protein [Variovorax ginsengisoli]|uniref:Uncharacterized protein n=1 Tax=Variovorax ginsengisoli TaxID=363844 RepID=A0ABT9S0J8_9BURK|nr:hypothetical protein [Variovorax ginsengisoli]MDP9897879.1 hypothetical protein [Variovorax ginsengisoli]